MDSDCPDFNGFVSMALQLHVGDEAEEAIKRKIRGEFSVFDKDSRNACDVREVRGGLFAKVVALQGPPIKS